MYTIASEPLGKIAGVLFVHITRYVVDSLSNIKGPSSEHELAAYRDTHLQPLTLHVFQAPTAYPRAIYCPLLRQRRRRPRRDYVHASVSHHTGRGRHLLTAPLVDVPSWTTKATH